MQDFPLKSTFETSGKIFGSMCAAMDCETFRRVVSVTSMPTGGPSFLIPNQSSPAACLLSMAAMEFRLSCGFGSGRLRSAGSGHRRWDRIHWPEATPLGCGILYLLPSVGAARSCAISDHPKGGIESAYLLQSTPPPHRAFQRRIEALGLGLNLNRKIFCPDLMRPLYAR